MTAYGSSGPAPRLEPLAEVRVGALDERERPLAQRLAEQVRDPVLRDDVVHVRPAGHDARALRERVDDARDRAVLRAVEGSAMMGLPPREREAPRMKSTWPPKPE